MIYSHKIGCFCLLAIAFPLSAFAQPDMGPGFDPRPVVIPKIQKTTPRPVNSMDLLTLRDFHGVQISPDGKYVAFVLGQAVHATNSYRSGLFVVGTQPGSQLVSLGTAGSPHWDDINQWWPEDPQWSPDSQSIYYRMKDAGSWQVWRWKRTGGVPVQITHAGHDVKSFQLSSDGSQLVLIVDTPAAVDIQQLAEHGILYDGSIQEGRRRPIVEEIAAARGGATETLIHDLPQGREHPASEKERATYGSWELRTYGSLEHIPGTTIFSAKEIQEQHIYGAKVAPDGRNVVYQRGLDDVVESPWTAYPLFSKPVGGGAVVALTPGASYIAQYWWRPDSKEIYYADYDASRDDPRPSKLIAVSATSGESRRVMDSPGFLSDYTMDRSGRWLACTHQNTTTPPELALVDLSKGRVRALLNVNPEFRNLQLSSGKRIDVFTPSGDRFWGHLVLPLSYEPGKRYPLIITTYRDGDAFLRGGVGDEYPIQVFAANGFAVLSFDTGRQRNHTSGDFATALLWWQSPQEGMAAAVAKLAERGIVDRSKVGITGLSHGAEMVEYGISHSDLFQAAIESGDGAQDPHFFYMAGKSWHQTLADLGLGGWPEGHSSLNWRRLSPALNAERVQAPLLSNIAESEYLAELQFLVSLQQLAKPVEIFVYPNELHIKNQPKHRYEIYQRNLDWFNFWLREAEDADSAKAGQYERWRELKKLQTAPEARRAQVGRESASVN